MADQTKQPDTQARAKLVLDDRAKSTLARMVHDWVVPRKRAIAVSMLVAIGLAAATSGYPAVIRMAFDTLGAGKYDFMGRVLLAIMAITVLRYATQAAKELGLVPDADWEHVAQNIIILKFPDGTTKENATYDGVTIKQADVNLLAYPLEIVSDRNQIEKDLKYYEPRYSPEGPAMGVSVLATLYARLNQPEKAYTYFVKGYKPNEVPPFGVIAETAGGTNPYFATGAGGMLQAVMFGFGGLNFTDAGITQLKTKLPAKWKSLEILGVGVLRQKFSVK